MNKAVLLGFVWGFFFKLYHNPSLFKYSINSIWVKEKQVDKKYFKI